MKDTTKKLIEKDPSLKLHKEAEFSSDTKGYSAFNDAGIEVETGEFLYALTRLLKPTAVLETGTHSIAFTPTASPYYIELSTESPTNIVVDSCQVEAAGPVT